MVSMIPMIQYGACKGLYSNLGNVNMNLMVKELRTMASPHVSVGSDFLCNNIQLFIVAIDAY